MLRINLLPPEKRTPEGTPPLVFGTFIASILILLAMGLWNVKIFMDLQNIDNEIEIAKQEKERLADASKKHKELSDKKKELSQRKEVLQKVGERKFLWSQAVDQVWHVLDRYRDVWITGLELKESRAARNTRGGGAGFQPEHDFVMECLAVGDTVDASIDFKTAMARNPTDGKMSPMSFFDNSLPLEVTTIEITKDWEESKVYEFEITMQTAKPAPPPRQRPTPRPAAQPAN